MHCPLLHQTPSKVIYIGVDSSSCPHSTVCSKYMQYAALKSIAARIGLRRMIIDGMEKMTSSDS